MKLRQIADAIGATLAEEGGAAEVEIRRVYASDRMSDLLAEVTPDTLLVTNLVHSMLLRPLELVDSPAICLVNAAEPDEDMLRACGERGVCVMVSPHDMFETCGRLYQVLQGANEGRTG